MEAHQPEHFTYFWGAVYPIAGHLVLPRIDDIVKRLRARCSVPLQVFRKQSCTRLDDIATVDMAAWSVWCSFHMAWLVVPVALPAQFDAKTASMS